ncbi:sensor histidine kinase [Sphaerisporangium rhizosphaerae]|uniref:histidine kinase n=1 Tax=Sphaerisporangium rhizosphaerae TaxID=2269375 RepID=A0ABW2NY20_9ACTN
MSSPPPIRTRLLRILALPLVSMVAFWGFIAYSSITEISDISRTQSRWQAIGAPVLQLVYELQRERQASAQARSTGNDQALARQRQLTDDRAQELRELIGSVGQQSKDETPAEVRTLIGALDSLQTLRRSADSGSLFPPVRVIDAYNKLIDDAGRQLNAGGALSDVSTDRAVRGMAAYNSGAEYLSRENAVLTSTIVQRRMTPSDRSAFVAAMTGRRMIMANAARDVGPDLRVQYDNLVRGLPYRRLLEMEDRVFNWNATGVPFVDPDDWKSDTSLLLQTINRDTQNELFWVEEARQATKTAAYWRIGLVLGLGLVAVIASILLSFRFGLSMIVELRRLQRSAVELAEVRLPRLVERLRRGDDVDPATEAPPLDSARTAEVERVVQAFSAVQRTAVEAAVSQATLRKGIGQVFLNLAWRNQALLHRQLTLLDTMERRVEEPDTLEDLFRLDHLTTRMRRHAENLVILSDSTPARRWRDPVPIFDVARSAVLEVEDYTRVIVPPMPQAPQLLGVAVADVIHLLAELVENAAVFSPPETTVHVRGMAAANGFAMEVEDRGLGLSEAALEELNAKLADPPEFDLVDSDRLGLFVVARLAARHGIKVSLRRSPYEGTTAIVLLPVALLATPDAPVIEPMPDRAAPAPAPSWWERSHIPSQRGASMGPDRGDRPTRALGTPPPTAQRALPAPDASSFPHRTPGASQPPAQPPVQPSGRRSAELFTPLSDRPPASPTASPPTEPFTAPSAPPLVQPPAEPPARPATSPAAPPAGRPSAAVPSTDEDDLDGLPIRVRQASMAPQLRRTRAAEQREVSVRSPEELFSIMSSMQRGWQQGRGEAEQK